MKKIYTIFLAFLCAGFAFGQTANSTQNGNWMNPTTWDCFCVPVPGYTITVNHTVTMDTSFAYTTGSITVSSGGTLQQDVSGRDIWLNGGSFTNNGTTDIRYLLLSSGTFSNTSNFYVESFANNITIANSGSFLNVDSLYNDGTINNNGTIDVSTFYNEDVMNNYDQIINVDSMFNNGTFLNDVNAYLEADSATNNDQFTNNGVIDYQYFTNAGDFTNNNYMSFWDMTNIGDFTNVDSLEGGNSMTNAGYFDNQNSARFELTNSFLNASLTNDAYFETEGYMSVGDSWYNYDTIQGVTGNIFVQDTSYNSGYMLGTFDFCDNTPPPSSPYVDFNLGTIDNGITFCQTTSVADVQSDEEVHLYPNPTSGLVNLSTNENHYITVYNVLGEQVLDRFDNRIDLSNYESGIYLIQLRDQHRVLIGTRKVIKE